VKKDKIQKPKHQESSSFAAECFFAEGIKTEALKEGKYFNSISLIKLIIVEPFYVSLQMLPTGANRLSVHHPSLLLHLLPQPWPSERRSSFTRSRYPDVHERGIDPHLLVLGTSCSSWREESIVYQLNSQTSFKSSA
jgi:hypothetical protein